MPLGVESCLPFRTAECFHTDIHLVIAGGPHLAKFYGATMNEDPVALVMEYMPGGDLEQFLRTEVQLHVESQRAKQFQE